MAARINLFDVFHGRKSMLTALGLAVIIFLLIELIIFAVFASTSGEQSRIEVRDKTGKKIYDVAGTSLSHINFSYFERKYGDLANYDVEVKTIRNPFPVRAWVSASIGVPMVLILLISYLVKVYLTLLQGGEHPSVGNTPVLYEKVHPFISWSLFFTSSSIFVMGVVIAGMALVFWMVPSFLGELVVSGASAVKEGGRAFQGIAVFLACLIVWVVYLRYRLSRRMMDYHYRLERQRLEQQMQRPGQLPADRAEPVLDARKDA